MSNTRSIECLIVPINPHALNNTERRIVGTGDVSVLQIQTDGANIRESIVFRKGRKMTLNFGDKIKCVSGKVLLFFHPDPGTARLHTLSAQPNGETEKNEVEVNQETTKNTTNQVKLPLTGVNHRVLAGMINDREGLHNGSYYINKNGR